MKKPDFDTFEGGVAWMAANDCGLNGLMQHSDKDWRCSIRLRQGERGMQGQHIWRDGKTALFAMQTVCSELYALVTSPPSPVPRKALEPVGEPTVRAAPRRAATNFDDVV